jgi:sigma-B regulation protein RsbU (phosphoserine phosphatase)
VAAIFVLPSASLFAQGPLELSDEERVWLSEHPTIRIAPAPNFPPVEFFDDQGIYHGIAADYAAILESKLGIRFEVEQRNAWAEVVEGTKLREVDVWMEAADTPERRAFMDFTEPYISLPAVIIVRRSLKGYLGLGDLEGMRVAVIEGYASAEYVRDNFPQLELIFVPSIKSGLERVSFGSADAVVANVAAASFYIEQAGLANLRAAGESGFVWQLAMGSRNDWPLLHGILQKALDDIPAAERRAIYRRWVALEAPSESRISTEMLIGIVAGLFILVLLGLRVLGGRGKSSLEASPGATLRESWPVMVTAGAAILVVIAAALWSQSILAEQAHRDVGNSLRTVLNTTSQAVYDWLRVKEAEVFSLSRRPGVSKYALELVALAEEDEHLNDTDSRADLRARLKAAVGSDDWVLLASDGLILAGDNSSTIDPGDSLVLSTEFLERLDTNPNHIAVELPSRVGSEDVHARPPTSILVGALIRGAENRPSSILVRRIDPAGEFTQILQRGRIGESGESYAINRHGQMISASRFEEDLAQIGLIDDGQRSILNIEVRDPGGNLLTGYQPSLEGADQPLTLMANSAISGRIGTDLDGYSDYRGVQVIGSWAWDGDIGLGITTEIDFDEAYTFLRGYRRQATASTSLAIALIIGLTALFIRSRMMMAAANAELAQAYKIIKKHKERMEEELNVGREIQMSMVPLTFPAFPTRDEFSVHAALHPAREVGGDFYDFYFVDQDRFCFCIGDVSGKGVPAALFMAVTQTLIKSRATVEPSTANILTHVNNELSANNKESMFVTVFLGILDLSTGNVTYTNAGHNPPYIKRADGELVRLDRRHGPIIGAVEGLEYGEDQITLGPADAIFTFTDGVTEAMNQDGRLYGDDRLETLLTARQFASVEEMIEVGVDDVWAFQGDAEQADDVTVMAVSFAGPTNDAPSIGLDLTVANRIDEIDRVNESFNEFAKEHDVPESTRRRMNLVFDELLNNIVSYAFEGEEEHQIEISISLSGECLKVTIADDGLPFDPFKESTPPHAELSIDERPIGGVGVHLVRNVMDASSYERISDKNVVTLEKKLDLG